MANISIENEFQFNDLVTKYLAGNISADEATALLNTLKNDEFKENWEAVIDKVLQAIANRTNSPSDHAQQSFRRFLSKIKRTQAD